MPNPWRAWDAEVLRTGRPDRVAAQMTDEDLVTLLAVESHGRREEEKRFLKRELHARLARARAREPDKGPPGVAIGG